MGGALRMNAGCFDGETWDYVIGLETLDRHGNLYQRSPAEFDISYRSVERLNEQWFVAATFELPKGDKASSMNTIKTLLAHRAKTQPTGELNCGSVFRNPEKDYAAKLIEGSGLKGMAIGHALVSNKHANFIINDKGCATAVDIENLINHVHETVLDKTGINLKCEVHILGDTHES
jgi:UDP-N-acetylmuramate dehydrogenase